MWDDFPKREIVCSTSKKRASTYGDVYLMIPYNGVDWGICPNYDIFYSFPHLFEATSNKIDGMNRFNHFLKRIIGEEPKSYDSLTQHLDMFGKKFKETNFNKLISTSDFFREHKSFFMKYKNSPFYELGKFSAFIFSLMDPYSNDFEYQSKWNGAPNNREVWTDGRCLMIRRKTFERIKTELI